MNGVSIGIAKYIKILPKIEIKNALLLSVPLSL
jgi:hypothetical protein